MIFKILIRYILGYVNISIQGYYIERFINVCISKGVFLWNVRIERSTYAHANVGLKNFRKLRDIAKKTNCRIKLNSRRGVPFLMDRYKKRKMFFMLLALITIFVYTESQFVWNIEVSGTERISNEEILSELAEGGLKIGAKKSSIKPKEIINQMRLKRDDIAWMNIDMKRNKYNRKNCRNNRKARNNTIR